MALNPKDYGFPDASTTGLPDGVTLTASGSLVITKAGTVISGLDIRGDIYVAADNVTIQNCKITSGSFQGINTGDDVTGLKVDHCEINGQGRTAGSYGIMGNGSFTNNDIYGFENGIGVIGDNVVVKGNYIHDLQSPGDPHYDGIAIQGGQDNVLVQDNTVIGRDTSDVFIKNDFGPISNVTVNHNFLGGDPGYMLYVDGRASGGPITGVKITDNYVDKAGYGYFSIDNSSPTISGNVQFDSDRGILPPIIGTPTTPTIPTVPLPTDPGTPVPSLPGFTDVLGTSIGEVLKGSSGIDHIYGGGGNDLLSGGGGADVFVYKAIGDSLPNFGARDLIWDFRPGDDRVDVSGIDAVRGVSGNQAFTWGGEGEIGSSSKAGTLMFHHETTPNGERTIIEGTVHGSSVEFEVSLVGNLNLSASDFIL